MVHVPILKIEIPEPRLSTLIPGVVEALVRALTAIYDFADDLIRPLTPEQQAEYDAAVIASLPIEHRIVRKRIVERNVTDMQQISEELEEATHAYYRRSIRESLAGFPDETAEDANWRRLVVPETARHEVWEEYEQEQAAASGMAGDAGGQCIEGHFCTSCSLYASLNHFICQLQCIAQQHLAGVAVRAKPRATLRSPGGISCHPNSLAAINTWRLALHPWLAMAAAGMLKLLPPLIPPASPPCGHACHARYRPQPGAARGAGSQAGRLRAALGTGGGGARRCGIFPHS